MFFNQLSSRNFANFDTWGMEWFIDEVLFLGLVRFIVICIILLQNYQGEDSDVLVLN